MKRARSRNEHYQSFNSMLDDLLKDPEYAAHLAPTFGESRTTNYTEPGKFRIKSPKK